MISDSLNNKEKKIGYRTHKENRIDRGLFQRIIPVLARSHSVIQGRTRNITADTLTQSLIEFDPKTNLWY